MASQVRHSPAPTTPLTRLDGFEGVPDVALRDLTAGYGTSAILKNLTLDVQDGEIFCVIGGSGSGKSTLLKAIIGFAQVLGGQLYIDGEEVSKLRETAWSRVRNKMGMVFQKAALFDSLTVYENVAFPLNQRYPKMTRREVAGRVFTMLDAVNLGGNETKYPNELSGGMQKRVGLARALIDQPKILLYDEPTSGLDPLMTAQIDALILQARAQFNVTSVVVSHDMESVWRIADRIAVLLDRKLKALGTPDDIRNSPDPEVQRFIHGQLPDDNVLAKVLKEQEARIESEHSSDPTP